MFSSIGLPEILVILVSVLVLFGGRKIPQLARDLGTGLREFKRSLTNAKDSLDSQKEEAAAEDERVPATRAAQRDAKKRSKKPARKS